MKTYLLEILTALTMTFTVSGQVLVDEQFTRSGTGPLNSSHPSGGTLAESITWSPGYQNKDWMITDAEAGMLAAAGGSAPGATAWLPVTFSAGSQYELTVQLTILGAANGNWAGIGFSNSSVITSSGWNLGTWMYIRGDKGYTPVGKPGTTSTDVTITGVPTVNAGDIANTLHLTLDTTGEDWTIAYYINDNALTTTPFATYTLTADQQTALDTVFLISYGNGATVDWFKLEQIPEPSVLLLSGIGALILALTPRRKR
ncbi:MAG: hypothetical protein LBK60_09070 [Verrucomicrobiales bacterium]|jgi:hypothetical protein|nr:hypothetical protein [Verrucomicrobiales bacterium]